jgi:hypothetical protein
MGEDPDLGECFAIVAYSIDHGQIPERLWASGSTPRPRAATSSTTPMADKA